MKVLNEWFIPAPWGKIALISYGNPKGYPVLLGHGRSDSSATFIPLLNLLPEDFYYVAFDLPGNGKSDPFPTGLKLVRLVNVVAVEIVVKHLKWLEFYYISHSLGTEIATFFNAVHPNRVKKFVFLDPVPSWAKIHNPIFNKYLEEFYGDYYKDYERHNSGIKVYTKEQAIGAVMRRRGLTRELAEIILSRNLIKIGDDKYRLSWDLRQMNPAPINVPANYLIELFTNHDQPLLLINAVGKPNDKTYDIIRLLERKCSNMTLIDVDGDHDVHLKKPEILAEKIRKFLFKSIERNRAKL